MSETLRWDFVGDDRLTDLLEKLDRTLSKVDRNLSGFGKTAVKVAEETKTVEGEVDDLGDKAERAGKKMERAFDGLGPEIAKTKAELALLQREFAKTGDIDLLGKIGKQKSLLGKLEGTSKDLEALGASAAKIFGQSFAKALPEALGGAGEAIPSEVKLILGAAVAGAAAVVAPVITSAIASAVLGGVGAGGIIGGIMLAKDDPRVIGAWQALGSRAAPLLQDMAKPFIEPLVAAPGMLEAALVRNAPGIRGIFADASKSVLPLVNGVIGLAERALPGIQRAVTASGPLLRTIGAELPRMGDALGKFFSIMSQDGAGAERALVLILRATDGLIINLAALVDTEARILNVASMALPKVVSNWLGIASAAGDAGDATAGAAAAFDDASTAAQAEAAALAELSDQYDKILNNSLSAQRAVMAYEAAIDSLDESLKKNGRTLDIHTEKGRENRGAILDIVDAAERERLANLAAGDSIDVANSKYQAQIDTLRAHLRQLHYSEAQINSLIGATNNLPRDIGMSIRLDGAGVVLSNLYGISNAFASLSTGTASGLGKARKRALGSSVVAGQLYQVNEQASAGMVEYFQPNTTGSIRSGSGGTSGPGVVQQPIVLKLDTYTVWQGLLSFKSSTGKISLELG